MRNAHDVPLDELLRATTVTIDRLLTNRPEGLMKPLFVGDTSDKITGIQGVQVFFYTDTTYPVNIRLQVAGPADLIVAVKEYYAAKGKIPSGGGETQVVFPVKFAPRRSPATHRYRRSR